METTAARLRRLIRARDRMQRYVKGLSTEDRRAARRAIEKEIDFLSGARRERINRGPRDARRKAAGCGGRVITLRPGWRSGLYGHGVKRWG